MSPEEIAELFEPKLPPINLLAVSPAWLFYDKDKHKYYLAVYEGESLQKIAISPTELSVTVVTNPKVKDLLKDR